MVHRIDDLDGWSVKEEELRAKGERASKATAAPWRGRAGQYSPEVVLSDGVVWSPDVSPQVWECDDEEDGCPEIAREWLETAHFIAAAREDVPALVAEVRSFRQALVRLVDAVAPIDMWLGGEWKKPPSTDELHEFVLAVSAASGLLLEE